MSEAYNFSEPRRTRKQAPAIDPEEREKQLIALVVDDTERKIRAGKAPTAVVLHYLKLASAREKLEREKLRKEIALLETKKQVGDASLRMEELAKGAIEAITTYGASINRDDSVVESK